MLLIILPRHWINNNFQLAYFLLDFEEGAEKLARNITWSAVTHTGLGFTPERQSASVYSGARGPEFPEVKSRGTTQLPENRDYQGGRRRGGRDSGRRCARWDF